MTPTKIGRYEIRAELGRGGMATVYRAYDPSFDREVAIKVLPRELQHDPQFHDRFKREIKTIASLEHPAIVPVYDVGEEDGVPYFVMRYMTGGSLSNWIQKGKFSLQDAARIIERVASALAYAHKNGIVHRDLKPDNILFDNIGDPFISDFGVAKFTGASTNLTGSGIIGTPAYMSPEQAQGEAVDNRSDIYGLGVIIFQMLSGKQPYNATTPMGVAVKHITEPVPEILKANPSLPEVTDTIIKTAMAKNKDNRYPTATALSQAMNQAAFGNEKKSSSRSGAVASAPAARGSKLGLIIAVTFVIVAALAAAYFFRNQLFHSLKGTIVAQAPTIAKLIPAPVNSATSTFTSVPQPSATFTLLPATATTAPTEPPASTVAAFAPACQPGVVSALPTPAIQLFNQGCNKKVPYAILTIPQGSTFTSLNPDFTCTNTGQPGDKMKISCQGKNPYSYNLKVCSPPSTPIASVNPGQCQQGTDYDSANQCCAAPQPDAGCIIYKVDLKTCSSP
jgi:serine/threonine protein kinase